jgi:S1-C subfamily serine protease
MKKFITILTLTIITTALVSTAITFTLFQKLSADLVPDQQEKFEANFVKNRVNIKPNLLPTDFVETSAKVRPAIVSIMSKRGEFGGGNGSGVIISEDGYIVTNNHVIANTDSFKVTTNDKKTYTAKIIGSDPTTDLALIKINAKNLPTATFGNSDAVNVGEWVLAVGNPFNLTSTVTLGIVSAKSRNINILSSEQYSVESFIQTDAVVNPGNSGGGLVDANGNLIGINAAILTETGSYEGYSFAIPSNLVEKVIGDLKDFGEVKRAILGVTIENVNEEVAKKNNLIKPSGVRIEGVNEKSSAAEAGFKRGDIIISVNGTETNSTSELQEKVARFRPGDIVSIEFIRNGKLQKKEEVKLKGID